MKGWKRPERAKLGPRWSPDGVRELKNGKDDRKKAEQRKLPKTLGIPLFFEGSEAPGEGQVGPQMGPSWGKMGSGSELGVIFGHL